jgi:cytoskeletal protein CcmA (bactofilin family)
MWKKEEQDTERPAARAETAAAAQRPTRHASSSERATIGRSISIRGDVTGDEDLLIQGRVDGSVDLSDHAVTVGPDGEVKASIVGRVVVVEGAVEGNLRADEQVVLRSSAHVQGDIEAPRVILEDGARFRGGVDMGEPDARRKPAAASRPAEAPEPAGPANPAEPAKRAESSAGKGVTDAAVKVGA